jgi:hypothetical protein
MDADTEQIIGLGHQMSYVRRKLPKALKESALARSRRPKEDKDSFRWEDSADKVHQTFLRTDNILHVCDREADSYEYMTQHSLNSRRSLVRAKTNRKFDSPEVKLKALREEPIVLGYTVKIPQKGIGKGSKDTVNRQARMAKIGLSYHKVTIKRPHDVDKNVQDKLSLNLIICRELDNPDEESRLCWSLYTNEPINSAEDALRIVHYE